MQQMWRPVSIASSFDAAGAEGLEAASDEIEEPTTPQVPPPVQAASCIAARFPDLSPRSAHSRTLHSVGYTPQISD